MKQRNVDSSRLYAGALGVLVLGALACSVARTPEPSAPSDAGTGEDMSLRLVDGRRADAPVEPGDSRPPPSNKEPTLSTGGSRLKAIRWEGEGTSVFVAWLDTKLGLRCHFRRTPDGQFRCLPDDATEEPPGFILGDCNRPAVAIPMTACPPPAYVLRRVDDVCPSSYRVFRLGALVPSGTLLEPDCGLGTGAGVVSGQAFAIGEELPLDGFVLGRPKMGPKVGRLANVVMETDDGARSSGDPFDTTLGVACGMDHAADGSVRCLPNSEVFHDATHFADAACTKPVGSGGSPACDRAEFVLQVRPGCPARAAVHRGGAKLQAHIRGQSMACVAVAIERAFPIGDEVPPSSFAEGTYTLQPNKGRLHYRMFTSPVGTSRSGRVYDEQLGIDCVPLLADDGKTRCLPAEAVTSVNHYADPSCRVPVVLRAVGACPVEYGLVGVDRTVCQIRRSVYKFGARHQGQVYGFAGDSTCKPYGPTDRYEYYLGQFVAPTAFVELIEVQR